MKRSMCVISFAMFAAASSVVTTAHADIADPSSTPTSVRPGASSSPTVRPEQATARNERGGVEGRGSAFGIDTSAQVEVRPVPAPVAVAIPPNVLAARRVTPLRLAATEYIAGAATSAITVPLTLALGTWLGSLSNDLAGAAIPSLLLFTLVPAFAVTGAEVIAGNILVPGVASMHPAIWPALATTVVSIAIGSLAGVSIRNAASFSVFSLVVSLVLPAGVTAVLHARRPRWAVDAAHSSADPPPPIAPRVLAEMRRLEDPYAAQTVSIPLFSGAF